MIKLSSSLRLRWENNGLEGKNEHTYQLWAMASCG